MIPLVVFWTKYTATLNGRVYKRVPCENCLTEYVYLLEREGTGVGTSVYAVTNPDAEEHAASAAEETLRSYLENDFDPVPCPVCGHYQRYMFPKLFETKSLAGPIARLLVIGVGSLDAVGALYWTVIYFRGPSDYALKRMLLAWAFLLVLGLVGFVLWRAAQARIRNFNPNLEDQQARIAKGRARAVILAEFERAQRGEGGPGNSILVN